MRYKTEYSRQTQRWSGRPCTHNSRIFTPSRFVRSPCLDWFYKRLHNNIITLDRIVQPVHVCTSSNASSPLDSVHCSVLSHDISRPLKSFITVSIQFFRGLPLLFLHSGTQCNIWLALLSMSMRHTWSSHRSFSA